MAPLALSSVALPRDRYIKTQPLRHKEDAKRILNLVRRFRFMFVNLTWDHGQDDSRRRIDPVIDSLRRRDRHGFGQNVPAGIGVAVVSRVIAAAHFDADAMAPAKQHAR